MQTEYECFVIYDPNTQMFAGRKSFSPDFTMCRIYKEQSHAENAARLKFGNVKGLTVVPILCTIEKINLFYAGMGGNEIEEK